MLMGETILPPGPPTESRSMGLTGTLVSEGYMLDRFQQSNKNNQGNRDLSVGKIHKSQYLSLLELGGEFHGWQLFEVCRVLQE